tara:strand:- start:28 stop:645 length:618 start_codon:yes stop_codon:yes gene_type:complete
VKINVGIFIFNDVEILDFTGPYEVFSSARLSSKVLNKSNIDEIYKRPSPFKVFTISEKNKPIVTTGGLKVISDYNFINTPRIDILLLPGGKGTRKLLGNKEVISWIKRKKKLDLILSVCTGSLLLATAGLLKNKKASTHWSTESLLKEISPSTKVTKKRFTLDTIYSSAGVSSGIDLSLKVVEQYFGNTVAKNTAKYMDYKVNKN